MVIVKVEETVLEIEYQLGFLWNDDLGGGFGFPCDGKGVVNVDALPEAARKNYESCLNGEYNVSAQGVVTYKRWLRIPAEGVCDVCGGNIVLSDPFLSSCPTCGADYNGSGQLLASRSQ